MCYFSLEYSIYIYSKYKTNAQCNARSQYCRTDSTGAGRGESNDQGLFKIKSTPLVDQKLLGSRADVVESLWNDVENGFLPLQKFSHVLKEHDLNCWLNFYRLFRPDDIAEFMAQLKQDVNSHGLSEYNYS